MYFYANSRGTLYIVLGALLLFLVAGELLFKILIGLLGLHLINYGFRLKGMPSMQSVVCSWLDQVQW